MQYNPLCCSQLGEEAQRIFARVSRFRAYRTPLPQGLSRLTSEFEAIETASITKRMRIAVSAATGQEGAVTIEPGITVSFVVAVARNGVIGRHGELPWRISSDLKKFRHVTMGKPILMGRKTWASLPKKPLDGRDNIVVTRDRRFAEQGALVAHSIEEALRLGTTAAHRRGVDEIAVIGGADIFRETFPHAGRIYLTEVDAAPDGDTFFPPLDPGEWRLVSSEPLARGPNDEAAAVFEVLERCRPATA